MPRDSAPGGTMPSPDGGLSRRDLLLGAGAAAALGGAVAVAAVAAPRAVRASAAPAARSIATEPLPPPVATPARAAQVTQVPGTPAPATPVPISLTVADALANGWALVASPRLPLAGVGPGDPTRLLAGEARDWRQLGAPYSLPVEVLALAGAGGPNVGSPESFPDRASLAEALRGRRGAVAMVPLELVAADLQALSVGGVDPLLAGSEPAIRIGIVGDIVPGRNVHAKMRDYGDFTRPFRRLAPLLRGMDLTIANLEGNLSDTLPQPADRNAFSFVSNTAMLDGFELAGIDAVTLANNHSVWNEEGWGLQGLLDTMAALEARGLPFFGAGYDLAQARAPWVAEVRGVRIAWLGIDGVTANYEIPPGRETGVVDFDAGATADRAGTNPYLSAQFLADIAAAREAADVVVPYFHMGAEYVAIPPAWVANGARAAIDAGATMVVTNHPHVVQGMEFWSGRPIVYSPGNFIIDQMWGVEVRSGYALEAVIRGGEVVGLRVHGTEIEDFHQPRRMTAGEQANLLDRFWSSVDRLAAAG